MKKLSTGTVIAIIVLLFQSAASRAQNTELTGNLKNLSDKTITIAYTKNGTAIRDTVKVVQGVFHWKTTVKEPQEVYVMFPLKYFPFFVQPGKIKLTGLSDSVETYKVSGSSLQAEADIFEASVKSISDQEGQLYEKYGKGTKEEQLALEEKLDELKKQKRAIGDKYIASHPKSFYSIYLINRRAMVGADYTDIKPLYDQLDESAKLTEQGKKIAERLNVLKNSRIGGPMLDFAQADTSGSTVRFSQFKGKYVLVDFWASWCGPCRAENPNVLKVYDAYKEKNFTVIGISLDNKADNWKKAIHDDKMPWTQLSDLKGWKNEVSSYFGIQGIPSNLLIDPSGKIIAKDLRGAMLEKKMKELLD